VLRSTQGKAGQASGTTWVRVLLCALLAVTPVLSLAHNAIVAHTVCAEHGESVHVGQPLARARVVTQQVIQQEVSSSSAATSEHGHEHCSILVHGRDRFALVQPPQHGVLATLAQPALSTPHARVFVATRPQFSLAPKGSPPV
jgi:hypothetical protein